MSKFMESKTWQGGAETGEMIEWLTPTGYTSPRLARRKAQLSTTNRKYGAVIRYDSGRGFGFVKQDGDGPDLFVHVSELHRAGIDRLTCGERLSFEVTVGKNGKPAAVNIEEAR